MDLGVYKIGEELEGFGEEESTVRIYCIKNVFTVKKKKQQLSFMIVC